MAAPNPHVIPAVQDPVEGKDSAEIEKRILDHDNKPEAPAYDVNYDAKVQDVEDGEDPPIAPDQFDPKWETSKWEIWAYYSYYSRTPSNTAMTPYT